MVTVARPDPQSTRVDFDYPPPPEPHPELGPATAGLHLWLVESAVCFHGADADAISAAVCLPPWNVRRALHALGLGPVAGATPAPRGGPLKVAVRDRGQIAPAAAAWLKAHGPATAREVLRGCGFNSVQATLGALRRNPRLFRVVDRRVGTRGGRPSTVWEARP